MKIKVELYGVLGKKIPEFYAPDGVDIELPDGSSVRDLLDHLKIPEEWKAAVSLDSRLLKQEDPIRDGGRIRIFQAVHGG